MTSSSRSRADTVAYEAVPEEGRGIGEAHGAERHGQPSRDLNGYPEAIVLFNNLANIPATIFQCPADEDGEGKARPRTRSRHAGECSGRMERRRHPREAGAERAVSPSCLETGRRRRPFSRSSRINRVTDGQRTHPAWRDFDSGDAEGHQACPPLRSSADGRVTLVGSSRNATRCCSRLCDLKTGLDSRTATETSEPGPGNASPVRRT